MAAANRTDPLIAARRLYEARVDLCRYVRSLIRIDGNFYLLKSTLCLPPAVKVLDVGFGKGGASIFFALNGREVTAIRPSGDEDIYPEEVLDGRHPKALFEQLKIRERRSSLEEFPEGESFDLIWMSHILEHTLDVGMLLHKARRLLSAEGWLCVIVPPFKHQVVMGHVSVGWNLGLLMHVLAVTGFRIRSGHFIRHGYNVAAFVQKGSPLGPTLDSGRTYDELSVLAFTGAERDEIWPIPIEQGFDGDLAQVNWFETPPPPPGSEDPDFELALPDEEILLARDLVDTLETHGSGIGVENDE